ncbi:MAG: 2-(1,2-epoxy,2-dihydrophenyl)acetyl-CoA isomerase [Solirubrobacteraceae bacterium]|jgi:2-(1,2-epoxy-1,2-dihydrophenyl)acetyl-CoA isomerase|nr:2-(1,2-epoxy,2-dihydrophenyl)acetyl-CoA isomerase [Solirubrobacteraceae bacterium]
MRTEISDGIAQLWFDRPDAANAVDIAAAEGFRDAAAALRERDDVRAVMLAGEGRFFCAGGDVRYFTTQDDPQAAIQNLANTCHAALEILRALDAPVVARVHGPAAGIGLSFVLACDLAIATDAAHFTSAYTAIGLSPDGGQSWLLPRAVGFKRATDMLMTNRRVRADEAVAWGMINEVVASDALDARVRGVCETLAAGPRAAFGATKRLLDDSFTSSFHDQMETEGKAIAALAGSPTGVEGAAAFVEKRRAEFP